MYNIQANGTFRAFVRGCCHCGPSKWYDPIWPRQFKYEVWCKVQDDGLDVNGFVINNLAFVEHFRKVRTVRKSCELLSAECVWFFFRLCSDGDKKRIIETGCRIWGRSGAFAEFVALGSQMRNERPPQRLYTADEMNDAEMAVSYRNWGSYGES
jgi:hypothetical protein